VLESSDGLEVIEIGNPAEHETLVDHELELPTTTVNRDRQYDGQAFVFHQLSKASWDAGPGECLKTRDTGIARATGNLAGAVVLRSTRKGETRVQSHEAEFFFDFVLSGSATLQVPVQRNCSLNPGDTYVIPADTEFVLSNMSADLELLQVTLPGNPKLITH